MKPHESGKAAHQRTQTTESSQQIHDIGGVFPNLQRNGNEKETLQKDILESSTKNNDAKSKQKTQDELKPRLVTIDQLFKI